MKSSLHQSFFALHRWCLFLLLNIAFCSLSWSHESHVLSTQRDYLLVINTYTSDVPWSNAIIEPLQKWVSMGCDVAVFVEHLNMLIIENTEEFDNLKDGPFAKYTDKAPKGILLLGNPAFSLRDKICECWGDVPIILCAEEDYSGPQEAYIYKRPILKEKRIPIAEFAEDYNLTLLQTRMFLRENVELLTFI